MQWIVSVALVSSSFIASTTGAAAAPKAESGMTTRKFNGEIVNFSTTRSYDDVIARLDQAINKTSTFLPTWHASKTHADQLQLIGDTTKERTFLYVHIYIYVRYFD